MPTLYSRWISDWEYKLATRDSNRVVRRFEWGLDWLGMPPSNGSSSQALREFVRGVLADSDRFFAFETPPDYRLDASLGSFLISDWLKDSASSAKCARRWQFGQIPIT